MMRQTWPAVILIGFTTNRSMSSFTNGIYDAMSTATSKILLHVTWLCMTVCCKSWHSLKESSAARKLLIFKSDFMKETFGVLCCE